ncbi:MAG: acetylornithine/succinylornithine family transaminase, partial [Ktedonobacteraceae bacterium]
MNATIELENTYTSGVYSKRSVVIVRGSGALLWDDAGREYIDCTAGHGVANIGHGRPEIAAALASQAQQLITCPEIVYNDIRARLLERLARLTPEGLNHFFLCNSGTEAVEGALKFARLATGRTGIIATLRGFHGRTMGALSTTWERHYREPFAPLVPGVSHVRYNDLAAMEAAINDETAAVIIELVQGEGGVHVASEEYVSGLSALCRERGALLIVDEIQTGFGRTGRLFACDHYNLQPDILCLAKSLAGGIPIGAVCLGSRVMESGRLAPGVHGSTFGGNPLACAAALTALDILEREALPERAATLGSRALDRLSKLSTHSSIMREVRGRGLLIGIELSRRVQPYLEALLERGILALPAGPNVIRLLPPLVITEEQLERALDIVEEVLGGQPGGDQPRPYISSPNTSPEVSLLHTMLTIPSYSRQEGTLARYLVQQGERMGLITSIDEVGNFVARTSTDVLDKSALYINPHSTGNTSVECGFI